MDSFTYAIILVIVFFAGIFVFTYFEMPRRTLNKGIKRLKSMQVINLNKINKSLTIPARGKRFLKGNKRKELKIYVHEY